MADIELVIDIPEEVYKSIQDNDYCGISNSDMYNAIKNGTPLSTDGDLISRTDLLKDIADLKKSPWFNDGKDIKDLFRHNSYVARKEAVEIIEDLCIKKLPSAENTAKWINETEETIECGNCHHIFDDFGLLNGDQEKFYEYPEFCPNCGRRMKGVSDGKTKIQSWQ